MIGDEDGGFRRYGSSGDMDRKKRPVERSAVVVLVFLLLLAFLAIVGIWNSMHVHAPATTTVFWNGQHDAKTSNFIHDLRNWVDPSFIYFPHRTAFFDADNIDSDELMLLADNVCRQFSQGVSYHDVDTTVQQHLKAPESPSFHFINQTVETYCHQFGALVQSGVTVTSG
jgi:hypothetical protein